MTIQSPSIKKCPDCAEEIKAEAVICRFCGARFVVERRGYCASCHQQVTIGDGHVCPECGTSVADEIWESRPLRDEPDAGLQSPPPPTAGEVREGIVGSLRMKIAEILTGASIGAMFLTSVLGFGNIESLAWARRTIGPQTDLASPAPGYVVGAFVAGILAAMGVLRLLQPRARDVGAAAKRRYRRRLRDEYGLRVLYVRRGMRGSIVTLVILLIGIGGIVLYNINTVSGDTGMEAGFGIYLALALTATALVGSLLAWPSRSAEVVLMDSNGGIHRRG